MCFMVVRLSPLIHLLHVQQLPKSRLVIFYWARRRNKSTVKPRILSSVAVPLAASGHSRLVQPAASPGIVRYAAESGSSRQWGYVRDRLHADAAIGVSCCDATGEN